MKSEKGIVKVGNKSRKSYLNASLYCIDHFNRVKIRGLGGRQGVVLEVAETLERIDGLEITAMNSVRVEDINGLEVVIERTGGGGSD